MAQRFDLLFHLQVVRATQKATLWQKNDANRLLRHLINLCEV